MKKQTLFIFVSVIVSIISVGTMTSSCNTDNVIEQNIQKPKIILDNSNGIYSVIQGETLIISPQYQNVDDATYLWSMNGETIGVKPELIYLWNEIGEYYITITVTTNYGSVSEELKVIVMEPALPLISLPLKNNDIDVMLNSEFVLMPEIKNSNIEDFNITWEVNSKIVSTDIKFSYKAMELGDFIVKVTVTNCFGSDSKTFNLHVVTELPVVIEFPTPSYFNKSTTRYTFIDRPIYISPIILSGDILTYTWLVDGVDTDCNLSTYKFIPTQVGNYDVTLIVNDKYYASVKVVCVDATENDRLRRPSATSSEKAINVFEWCPAPGQFIGDTNTGGMTGNEISLDLANKWALSRLNNNNYVSLGGFGGYIIVGFDHSVLNNNGDYDFEIFANAFFNAQTNKGGSNEPGIIYVMQDVNGNGLPDDEWYELRGSNTGLSGTLQNYAVTYYKPAGDNMNILWTDNYGNSGCIDYLKSFHRQPSYYPGWITASSYTLYGTCLPAQNVLDSQTGMWDNPAYGWGYADNMGSDVITSGSDNEGNGQSNGFKISNAMYPDNSAIVLKYIDFIKVQTGVNTKSGYLGELSTEVFGFIDL